MATTALLPEFPETPDAGERIEGSAARRVTLHLSARPGPSVNRHALRTEVAVVIGVRV